MIRAAVIFLYAIFFLAGCGATPVVGLIPVYPPVEVKSFALFGTFVGVDSCRPTFRWQPFAMEDAASRIENVTYEMRVWTTTPGLISKTVYTRNNLTAPFHKIEIPLAPGTRYLWSVRAHFLFYGKPRVTEWTLAGYTLRSEAVPNASCLRFQTPKCTEIQKQAEPLSDHDIDMKGRE